MKVRQPRRAAVVNALLLSLLSSTSSWAADKAAEGLQRCRALTESAARLSCYDALAEQSAKAAAGPAVASATVLAAPAAAPAAAQTFGLPVQRQNEPDVIKSQIEGLVEGWGPGRTFTLANGQVWQVSDGSSAVLYLKNPQVEIRRAALGTFMLELEGTNETARVKRLR